MSQFFYDGQIRRYITQMMRLLSNFPVKDGKGKLKEVPVMYGDLSRQVANIIRENSENKLPSAPRISVYITGLELDRDRATNSSYTDRINVRERKFDAQTGTYSSQEGTNYTIERLIPTPYILKINADIWASNTDQKLQLIEQIGVWFNPGLEIQTTDNYVDWTSITVVYLESINWSNRSIPVGVDSTIDIATLSFSIPIYISPPAKVKKLGVITNIITSIFNESTGTIESGISTPIVNANDDYFKTGATETEYGRIATTALDPEMSNVNYDQYPIYVDGTTVKIIYRGSIGNRNWQEIFDAEPGNYRSGISRIFLSNEDSDAVVTGTVSISPFDKSVLVVNWDEDSFPQDTVITGPSGDKTTIDYIVDPTRFNPINSKQPGIRLLLLDDIGSTENTEGPVAWKNADNSDFIASANDIVEWDGNRWHIVFDASVTTEITYVTNLNTGTQYRYDNENWLMSIDGEYPIGTWRLSL